MSKTLVLTNELNAVAEAASKDNSRPALNQVDIDNNTAVATDGFLLALTKVDCDPCQIPAKLIKKSKITKLFTPSIEVSDSEVRLDEFDISYVIRTGEKYNFPDTKKIVSQAIKNEHFKITLGVDVLKKVVAILGKTKQNYVTFKFSDNNLQPVYGKSGAVELVIMPVRQSE